MSKNKLFLTVLLFLAVILASVPALYFAYKNISKSAGEKPAEEITDASETLLKDKFDEREVYDLGLLEIKSIAEDLDEFLYWQEAEITDFKFLYSFKTGANDFALFELTDAGGQSGFMIYDCESGDSSAYAAGESPYKALEKKIADKEDIGVPEDVITSEPYYFYYAGSYGYGVINEKGLFDIYNVWDMAEGLEAEVLRDVSFAAARAD